MDNKCRNHGHKGKDFIKNQCGKKYFTEKTINTAQSAQPATVDKALDYVDQCRKIGSIHHPGFFEKDSVRLKMEPANRLLTVCH